MKRAALPLAALVGVVLLLLSFVGGEPEAEQSRMARATTYSPGPWGSKALFRLFDEIGLRTQRLRRPAYDQLSPKAVLWVLASEPFGRVERRGIVRFLGNGGTLVAPPETVAVLLEEAKLGTPEPAEQTDAVVSVWGMSLDFEDASVAIAGASEPLEVFATAGKDGAPVVAAWKIGEGRAVSLGIDQLARNNQIGRAGNGLFLARLALTLGSEHVFDEFKTGFGDRDLMTLLAQTPYRWGVAQIALVCAVGLFAFARRRLPAEPLGPVLRRRTLDHVEAVARLWEQAGDAGLPLRAILNAVTERARTRLGGVGNDNPFLDWIERARPELASKAKAAWAKAEWLCNEVRPSLEDARRAAMDIKNLEREGLKW